MHEKEASRTHAWSERQKETPCHVRKTKTTEETDKLGPGLGFGFWGGAHAEKNTKMYTTQ